MRKHASNLVKLLVTAVALYFVLREVDLSQIWQTLRTVRLGLLVIGVLMFSFSMVIRAARWWVLLRGVGNRMPFLRLVELYFVGNFFNMALPSGFGGDVVRVVEAARDVPADVATGTVLLDRLIGLVMLFVVALLLLPWQTAMIPPFITWTIVAGAVGGLLGILLLMDGRLLQRFGGWLPKALNPKQDGPVGKLLKAVQGCGWRAILQAMSITLLFHLLLAGWWLVAGLAFGESVSYLYQLFIMPLVAVPLLIPSFAGFGPREAIVPTLYGVVGVAEETAVAMAVFVFVITRLSGLVGAPLYLFSLLRNSLNNRNAEAQISQE